MIVNNLFNTESFFHWKAHSPRAWIGNGVHSACTRGPHKDAELHIHDEGINNKYILNVASLHKMHELLPFSH